MALARAWVKGSWPRTAMAAAKVVQTHDEEAIGVDGFPRTNACVTPARLGIVLTVVPGGVMVA